MIEERVAGIDICVPQSPEGMCSCIFSCWHDTRQHTCRHFDRGRSHSIWLDKNDQNMYVEELPRKAIIFFSDNSEFSDVPPWRFSDSLF